MIWFFCKEVVDLFPKPCLFSLAIMKNDNIFYTKLNTRHAILQVCLSVISYRLKKKTLQESTMLGEAYQ